MTPEPRNGRPRAASSVAAVTRDQTRVRWVDTGRGVAIILVVLYHAAQWLEIAGFQTQAWQQVNVALASLRMPLFFTISGMFASKWLLVSWPRLWSGKVSLFAWVFMLWSFLSTGPFILGLIMDGQSGNFLAQYRYVVTAPFAPRFELWFLWALSLFFVVAKVSRSVPTWIQMSVAGVLSVTALSGWDLGNVGWTGACKYYFFFALGLHFRSQVFALGRSERRVVLAVTGACWATLATAGVVLDLNERLAGYYFVTALLGVVSGVSASRVLARVELLQRIGRQTLPVYLTHTSIILVLAWFLHYLPPGARGDLAAWVVVPVLAAVAAALGLGLARVAQTRRVLSYLFEAPPVVSRAGSRSS